MSAATGNTLPLTKVDAIIPRAHNPERVFTILGFELEQCQLVYLTILTNNKGEKQAKAPKKINVCMEKDEDGRAELRCEQSPIQCG